MTINGSITFSGEIQRKFQLWDSIPPEYLLSDTPIFYTDQAPLEHFSDFLYYELWFIRMNRSSVRSFISIDYNLWKFKAFQRNAILIKKGNLIQIKNQKLQNQDQRSKGQRFFSIQINSTFCVVPNFAPDPGIPWTSNESETKVERLSKKQTYQKVHIHLTIVIFPLYLP